MKMIISKKRLCVFSTRNAFWILLQMHVLCQVFVSGIPVNIEPTDQADGNYPIAYNLHSLAAPRDINNLDGGGGNDLVKRALYDVTATINEVQRLLNADPSLPRLTRGEIEDLLEKVTKEELDKSIKSGNKRKEKRMRALMLVLPFNTDNTSNESLQDLYTRAPITKMVTTGSKTSNYKYQQQQQIQNLPSQTGKVEIVSTPYLTEVNPTTYRPHKQKKVLTTTKQPTTTTTTTKQPLAINQKAHFVPTQLPIPADPTVRPDGKFSSHYNGEIPLKPSTKPAPIRENVKDILASIGLYADESQKSRAKVTTAQNPSTVTTARFNLDDFTTTSTTSTPSPTTTRKPITPELEQLLKTFGFLNGNTQQPFKPLPPSLHVGNIDKLILTPEIHADDYSAFKPLPEKAQPKPLNSEMEEFLKTYGLLDLAAGDVNRKKKSMKTDEAKSTSKKIIAQMEEMPEISVDYLTPEMKKVLDNLGVGMVDSVKPKPKTRLKPSDEEDLKKLQELFETVKQLDALNSTLTEKDFEQLDLGRFNFSESLLTNGPDPFDHVEHFQSKNEIKRQQDGSEPTRFSLDLNSTTEDIDDAGVTESIVTVVKTETKNSALDDVDMDSDTDEDSATSTVATSTSSGRNDLSDSFPGGVDPIPEEDLPPPRRNGFYFLADWNSFLEVGEDPNRVVVRFDPKVGDSSRFLPVNVP